MLDRHIETEDQDAFGHRHYAQALRCLIEDQGHRPPFSIGLLGGWGTGKSSVNHETHFYDMGHEIIGGVLTDFLAWLQRVLLRAEVYQLTVTQCRSGVLGR